MFTRRQTLKSLFAAGTGALLTGLYTWRVEPHWLELTYPVLPVRGLPRELVGACFAALAALLGAVLLRTHPAVATATSITDTAS